MSKKTSTESRREQVYLSLELDDRDLISYRGRIVEYATKSRHALGPI